MRTKQISVDQFLEVVRDAGACKEGIASFNRKGGSVKQRLRKMCEVANRRDRAGHLEDGYLRWLTNGPEGSPEFLGFPIGRSPGKGWCVE